MMYQVVVSHDLLAIDKNVISLWLRWNGADGERY